jgi:penicillin-binding protein 1C
VLGTLLTLFWFSLPDPLFKTPTSTVIEDEKGQLLSAHIAEDGQWRFPLSDSVPHKFKQAIIAFEDQEFEDHIGVNFTSLAYATYLNIKEGRIVRGGSTLPMQVIRISRKNPSRTVLEKLLEIILALRLELSYSKDEILKFYASEAPFGGNSVGLEAASWRYFGQPACQLSWAESCMLAVLPNSPALIFPGKNQEKLKVKRDRLLKKLYQKKIIDQLTYESALKEEIPSRPGPLPAAAPHFLNFAAHSGMHGKRIVSTISSDLQQKVNNIIQFHHLRLSGNEIYNAAAIVVDIESGQVKAYCGNIPEGKKADKGFDVDIIQAQRSTGSILKPLLFSLLADEGKYLPTSLVADVPTIIAGYAPKNYYLEYQGAIPLKAAIARSLNVPAVRLLHEYGIEKFHGKLKNWGMSTLTRPAGHYGLSIILGGAEGRLYDMAKIYRNLAWQLNHYHLNYLNKKEKLKDLQWHKNQKVKEIPVSSYPSAAAIWSTFEAMNEVSRPEEDQSWKEYSSAFRIAWKTGTSFGNRDGWAVGCTPQYVVAVWVGNASGEGRPGLTGIDAAAPVMFDIFRLLKSKTWFRQPFNNMKKTIVCRKSGFQAGDICEETDSLWVPLQGANSPVCPYHKAVFLSADRAWSVHGECEAVSSMVKSSWFILPPAMEYFYRQRNPSYLLPPPLRSDCRSAGEKDRLAIIYPLKNSSIHVPRELDGTMGRAVFEAVTGNPSAILYWYLDNFYLGSTTGKHSMGLNPEPGRHKLTVSSQEGESREVWFDVRE